MWVLSFSLSYTGHSSHLLIFKNEIRMKPWKYPFKNANLPAVYDQLGLNILAKVAPENIHKCTIVVEELHFIVVETKHGVCHCFNGVAYKLYIFLREDTIREILTLEILIRVMADRASEEPSGIK